MPKRKILITVKTYLSISSKYDELVCTAGIDEDGNWVRIYPIPYRKLDYNIQYQKYHWIEMDLVRNTSDFRLESYRPVSIDSDNIITFHGRIGTENNWEERKKFVLKNIYTDLDLLISEAKTKGLYTSLAILNLQNLLILYMNLANASGVISKRLLCSKVNYLKKKGILKLSVNFLTNLALYFQI